MTIKDREHWRLGLTTVALALVMTILLLEGGVRFYQFATNEPSASGPGAGSQDNLLLTEAQARIHPYFGFVRPARQGMASLGTARLSHMTEDSNPPWLDITVNNQGFWSRHNYPVPTQAGEFVVGVFGGSVAQFLATQGETALRMELSKLPPLAGRRLTILNVGSGGYKQPQQLFALGYLLAIGQRFDAVVNLDGFNEITLSTVENSALDVDFAMPRTWPKNVAALTSIADEATMDWLMEIQRQTQSVKRWQRLEHQHVSAALSLLASSFARQSSLRLQELKASAPSVSTAERSAFFAPPARQQSMAQTTRDVIAIWSSASVSMAATAQAHGAVYLHVLQPNQYFSAKLFDAAERAIALDPPGPYAASVRLRYPMLKQGLSELDKMGVHTLDATALFDATTERIYADNCCHYNDRGNQMLAQAIAQALAALLPQTPEQPAPSAK